MPQWEEALTWLDERCGGRDAVLGLDVEPLPLPQWELPERLTAAEIEQARSIDAVLERVSRRFFDDEVRAVLRWTLLSVLAREKFAALGMQQPERAALGLVWVVGKANALLGARGLVTEKALKEFLDVSGISGSTAGEKIRRFFVGIYPWRSGRVGWGWGVQDYEAMGESRLLLASTRKKLIDVRERAFRMRAAASAEQPDDFYRAG